MAQRKSVALENNTARNIAVNSLLAFNCQHKQIQKTLAEIFQAYQPREHQKRQAAELAYGSCRSLISLDHIISRHSNRPVRKIDAALLQVLRVGLYQMLYLKGSPDFAVINEAVQQAKSCGLKGADGFVNALLRSVQRDIEGPIKTQRSLRPRATFRVDENQSWQFKSDFLPDPVKNKAKYYSLSFGHPLWLIERWLKRYDEKTLRRICQANNSRPNLSLRANRLRCSASELQRRLEEAGWRVVRRDDTIFLLQPAMPEQLPGYDQGWFSVQDITATRVATMLQPQPGDRVLDLCAAPGGKTTHIAELMDNKGSIIACDVNRDKLRLIEENCLRLGILIVKTCLSDELENLYEKEGPFDAVLVDAPCSNTGVMARRVEVRHRLKPVHISRLCAKQMKLLIKAGGMVKNQGKLVYSTCSIEPAENDLLVQEFLNNHSSFRLIEEDTFLPSIFSCEEKELHLRADDKEGHTKTGTGQTSVMRRDGGYAAVLRKD
jgi:16S rRNA (cytosine967-C5)-methyltransferase